MLSARASCLSGEGPASSHALRNTVLTKACARRPTANRVPQGHTEKRRKCSDTQVVQRASVPHEASEQDLPGPTSDQWLRCHRSCQQRLSRILNVPIADGSVRRTVPKWSMHRAPIHCPPPQKWRYSTKRFGRPPTAVRFRRGYQAERSRTLSPASCDLLPGNVCNLAF